MRSSATDLDFESSFLSRFDQRVKGESFNKESLECPNQKYFLSDKNF